MYRRPSLPRCNPLLPRWNPLMLRWSSISPRWNPARGASASCSFVCSSGLRAESFVHSDAQNSGIIDSCDLASSNLFDSGLRCKSTLKSEIKDPSYFNVLLCTTEFTKEARTPYLHCFQIAVFAGDGLGSTHIPASRHPL